MWPTRTIGWIVGFGICGGLLLAWIKWKTPTQVARTERVSSASASGHKRTKATLRKHETSPHVPIQASTEGFVGSSACQECHQDEFQSWRASYHRRMTQLASQEAVIGNFDLPRPVRAYGRDFLPWRRGDEFWVESDAYEKEETEDQRINRKLVLTTGSHHMQIYWYATEEGRSLAQLPIAWLKETQSWVPTSSLFIAPPGQPLRIGNRRWNEVCIKCHTTNGQPKIDESNPHATDTRVAEFGISCEACHGPGEGHILAQRDPRTDAVEDTIVHPATISHQRSAQICGQCHGNWLPDDESGLDKYLREGSCFRAGDDLGESRHLFALASTKSEFIDDFLNRNPHYFEDRYWGDGAIRVSGGEYNGLAVSKCFTSGKLSCITCHQMHHGHDGRTTEDWANDQLRLEALGQAACLPCHAELKSDLAQSAHSHHPVGSSGNACYNCHMPHTSYGLLKAIRSHTISSPSVQESLAYGRPNACNQCHLDKTLAWTANQLAAWYDMEMPAAIPAEHTSFAAMAVWGLRGDAGQRALSAWSFGWEPAQHASRTDWIAPILAQLLADPYEAVRHIARRSLRTLPEFEDLPFEYVETTDGRKAAALNAYRTWQQKYHPLSSPENRAVLLSFDGTLLGAEFSKLNRARNNREVVLAE